MRLGVYLELPYRHDERGYSTSRAFVRFLFALRPHFKSLVLIGRLDPEPGRAAYAIPEDVELAPLPYYSSLRDLPGIFRALPRTMGAIWKALDLVDVVWAIGPHPMSLPVVLLGVARRKRVVLGVRQDFREYVGYRLPGARWRPALAAAAVLEWTFALLARRLAMVAVGPHLARRYAAGSAPVLELIVSLVSEAELAAFPARSPRSAEPCTELLSVGRLDSEKAPELLLDMLERLRASGGAWRLTVVGEGPLAAELRAAARPLGEAVRFLGYVPYGPRLLALYGESDVFVHTARTEGFPQVLVEAQACGLPIVATDVGGVRAGLEDESSALLVPPNDPDALADAVARLAGDGALHERLARRGLEHAARTTIERQTAAVAAFLQGKTDEAGTQPATAAGAPPPT